MARKGTKKYTYNLNEFKVFTPFVTKQTSPWFMGRCQDPNGKKHTTTLRAHGKQEASQMIREWVMGLAEERFAKPNIENKLFKERVEEYLKNLHSISNRREKTISDYKFVLKRIFSSFNSKTLEQISLTEIENLVAGLKNRKTKEKVRDSTKQKYWLILQTFFSWAVEHKYLKENPIQKPFRKQEDLMQDVGIAFNLEQCKEILKNCIKPVWLKLAVLISLKSGLRKGILMSLTYADVIFSSKKEEYGKIKIPRKRMKFWRENKRGPFFEIPLDKEIERAIRDQIKMAGGAVFSEWFILTNSTIKPGNPMKPFNRCLNKSGLLKVLINDKTVHPRWHDLRVTFKSFLIEKCPYYAITQEMLDHAVGTKIDAAYSKVSWEGKIEAIKVLPKFMEEEIKSEKEVTSIVEPVIAAI